ncbi:glycoside hydrolase family 78 protein [Paramyrothecium foliicola]|nr:glycoside hydrolase family 78 protein [Paramyrothecium foliicola]
MTGKSLIFAIATLWTVGRGADLAVRGANALSSSLITIFNETITLKANVDNPSISILDYGHSVEGIPSFEVVEVQGDTSVLELTYSESKAGLESYMGDGPIALSATMDTYRVNSYNISSVGVVTNRLIQGAFRYQKLNLSSSGELKLRAVGVIPTTNTIPVSQLSGSFESSDEQVNSIWTTGARTVQLTEFPKNSIPDFWVVTSEGSLVESLAPQALRKGLDTSSRYNVAFDVKVNTRGFAFSVLSDTLNSGIHMSVDCVEGLISVHEGSTTLDPLLTTGSFMGNVTLPVGSWHSVATQVNLTEIAVSVNGMQILAFSQTSKFFGSIGLGASLGQSALFGNLRVTSLAGDLLYTNPLNDREFLDDFFMGSNPLDTSVDGSRRDRIAYAGDLDVAGASTLVSTHGLEFVVGTLELLGSYQTTPGFFIPTASIQQEPLPLPLDVNVTGLLGYSFNLLTAAAATFMHTGDTAFAQRWAPKVRKMLDWADSQTLENGLFNLTDITFGGDWNYYDPPQAGVVTKFNMLYAYSLQQCLGLLAVDGEDVKAVYAQRLTKLRQAIDQNLWSDELNAYYLSETIKTGFGQDSNALAILAGVNLNSSHSTQSILSTMSKELLTSAGPFAFSSGVHSAGFRRYISPFASAYHLRAAFSSGHSEFASELLDTLWAPMATPGNENYTGAFWEVLDEHGRPGLGLGTSLCHAWAAGPTAELSTFVLGARPTKPGWSSWLVAPEIMSLDKAKGRVPTPGGPLSVSWRICKGLFSISVTAPAGTSGIIAIPKSFTGNSTNRPRFMMNGEIRQAVEFQVEGGSEVRIVQF